MPINYYIFLSLALFAIGIVGVLTRRNAIIIFMCIELMLNAVNLLLVAFSKMHHLKNVALDATAGTDGQLVELRHVAGGLSGQFIVEVGDEFVEQRATDILAGGFGARRVEGHARCRARAGSPCRRARQSA